MSQPSRPAPLYVVTLTAAELDALEVRLGRKVDAKLAPASRASRTSAARGSRPSSLPWRAHGPAPDRYQESTPALEAWLAERRNPAFVPRPIPTPPLGKPSKLTDKERARHEAAWRDYAETGKADGNAYPVTEYVAALGRHVATLDTLAARA